MKTKVIHLTPHLNMGGAESLVKEYALNIDKNRFEIIIITVSGHSNSFNENELQDSNIKIIHLGDIIRFDNNENIIRRILKKIRRYSLFKKIIKVEKPHIIHSHLQTNDFLCMLNVKQQIRMFHTLHSEVNVLFRRTSKIYEISTRYCISVKKMKLITLHDRMKLEAQGFFKTKNCITINNGIDLSRFNNPNIDKRKIKKELGIHEDCFVIGHIGRFSEAKNHDFIIDVFNELKQKKSKAVLVLIGVGELLTQTIEKVNKHNLQESVLFLGTRKDIPEMLSIMDVFIFPSIYEGFPITLIEAQASGIRCIVSDKITREVFLSDTIYSLSLDDSISRWCDVILNNYSFPKNTGNMEEYDIKNVMKKLESVYISELETF